MRLLEEYPDGQPQCHKECCDLWVSDPAKYQECLRPGEEEDDFDDHPLDEEAYTDIEPAPMDLDTEIEQIQQEMKKIQVEKEKLLALKNQISQRIQEAD